jgi:DNA-binding Xre family transcriptional regulator
MGPISTKGRLTILIGQRQAATGERISLRSLAQVAQVPKDLVYRLDAGEARYVDLRALARLCTTLHCRSGDILVWEEGEADDGAEQPL